jgi:hypothetical protein
MSKFESTDGWIFLSVAYSAQHGMATLDDFYAAADHINCAIPTRDEIQGGINRLATGGLARIDGGTFGLTERGRRVFEQACQKTQYPRLQLEFVQNQLQVVRLGEVEPSQWKLSAEDSDEALRRYDQRMKKALREIRAKR